jgi:hypothetical protein
VALLVIARLALRLPALLGRKAIFTVQLAPGPRLAAQLPPANRKSPAFAPTMARLMTRAPLPAFLIVSVRGALVVLTS